MTLWGRRDRSGRSLFVGGAFATGLDRVRILSAPTGKETEEPKKAGERRKSGARDDGLPRGGGSLEHEKK